MPPSPEDSEVAHWAMPPNSYLKQDNGLLDSVTEGAHDPEILEAAHLLLPNGLPHGLPSYSAAQHSRMSQSLTVRLKHQLNPAASTTPYIHEEPHHYEEFTNFLDSLHLPVEWPGSGSGPGTNEGNHTTNTTTTTTTTTSYPTEVAQPGLHPLFRERERDRSRAGSPFRPWLPGDHHGSSNGMVSEYGNLHHYYHPPEEIARAVVPNF